MNNRLPVFRFLALLSPLSALIAFTLANAAPPSSPRGRPTKTGSSPAAGRVVPAPAPDVIAIVEGIPIRQAEWDRLATPYFKEVEARASRKLTEDEKRLLRRNLLDELIRERLWLADARRRGMLVRDDAIDARMKESAFFKTNGKVDEGKFLAFKRNPASNYAALRSQVGMGLLLEDYMRWMERRFGPREAEVRKAFQERTSQATIRYFVLGPEAVSLEPEAGLKQIRVYYEAHPAEFQSPDSARIQYVKIPIEAASGDSAREAAASAALKLGNDLLLAIKSGAPVETAAKVHGGLHDTGWFRIAEPIRGLGRSEAIQEAIRSAAPGSWVKAPIRNGPYYLVINLLDRKASHPQSFREVARVAKAAADKIVREGEADSLGREELRVHPETYAVPRLHATLIAQAAASIEPERAITPKEIERALERRRKAAKVKSGNRAWADSVRRVVTEELRRGRREEAAAHAFRNVIARLKSGESGERVAEGIGGVAQTIDLYRGQPIEAPILAEGAFLDSLYTKKAGTIAGPELARDSIFVVRVDQVDPKFVPPYEAVRQAASSNALLVKRWALEREAERYYQSHQDDYRTRPEWIFDYVYFRQAKAESVAVPESSVVAYYESHPLEFTAPATAKPRIILFQYRPGDGADAREKARQRALAARERIAKGEDFAAVAKEVSDDPQSGEKGGSIGEVTKGSLMKELADVIFSIPIGEVSDVVEARTAFHVIRVDERTDERLRTLAESQGEIQTVLGEPIADSLAHEAAARFAKLAALGASFDSLAATLGGAKRSEPIQAGEELPGIGSFEAVASEIGSLEDLGVTPEPIPLGKGYLVARRVREVAPEPAPFEQVKQRAINDYQIARRRAIADSLSQNIREAIARGSDVEPLFEAFGGMRSSRSFPRAGPIPDFMRDPGVARDSTLLERIFSARPGKALPPIKSAMGTIFAIVESVSSPPASDFARRRDEIWREIVDQRVEAWTARLRSRAQVTLYRKDLKALAAG